jgi:two-component system, NarL family, nitrate/nitrite response regulator NarL
MDAMDTGKPIRVLAMDGSAVVLETTCSFLKTKAVVVIYVVRNAIDLMEKAQVLQPDLVLLNISTNDMDTPERVAQLRTLVPNARIVVFSVYDLLMTRTIFLQAGADAVIQGEQLPERVVAEIRRLFADK